MKLLPPQVQLEFAGQTQKTVTVNLLGDQTLDALVGSPQAWRQVQNDRAVCLHRGDTVHIWSSDGLVLAQGLTVIRSLGGEIWLSKPLRLVTMEAEGLFEDAQHVVIPVGAGFSIRHKRGGALEGRVYPSVAAAQSELNRRAPVQV